MKVAISAFACSENRGSEHELGWKCLKELAAKFESIDLFTTGIVNPGIVEQVARNGLDNVTVHRVDYSEKVDRWLKSIPGAGYQVAAYFWEFRLFAHMLKRYKREYFDLAIKSTYGSYRWPSFLWYFSKDLQLDPLSGGGGFPLKFRALFSPAARRRELLRLFGQRAAFFDPFVLLTLCKASKLHVGNISTKRVMPKFLQAKCIVKPDFLSVRAEDFKMQEAREKCSKDPEILKIFHIGKLLEWKGVMVILQALTKLPEDVRYEFVVMGNGPAREYYDQYISEHGLNVSFVDPSEVPRPDLSFWYFSHDLFAFPTLHGESGYAPVEAKLHGMKLLTLDFCGLDATLTKDDVCIACDGKEIDTILQDIADAISSEFRASKSGLNSAVGAGHD
ncbi:MAG: glycosyltransferase [Opitutaceae bacterium]